MLITAKISGKIRQSEDADAMDCVLSWLGNAFDKGYYNKITPVTISGRRGDTIVEIDEHPQLSPETQRSRSIESDAAGSMAKLRPVFKRDGIKAANASGINDGAGAMIINRDTAAAFKPGTRCWICWC